MATWSLVRPGAIRAGHAITMGMRSPPSSKSVFLPVNGQVSAKRSPPLSLVKMTIVFSVEAVGVESLEHAADLRVHSLDHALIGLLRAAVEVAQARACHPFRFRFVAGPLPWPVRRIEVQADQERLAGLRIRIYRVDRAGAELVGEIADLMDLDVLVPQIMPLKRVDVREIVHGGRRGNRRSDHNRS